MIDATSAIRLAYPRALSTLVRVTGSLDEALDLLQTAVARALERWPVDGVPDVPEAWLVRTSRNHAIDGYRRRALERRHATEPAVDRPRSLALDAPPGLRDDMLRLVFTCCHPVLSRDAQVALTLKAVAGLSCGEIARAFLVSERTMEQRLTRAKRRIREAGVPYEVPSARELPERLASALAVVHVIFTEGSSASSDAPVIRHELCRLAIGQARRLHALFPTHAETAGLLALLLFTYARTPARLDGEGRIVPLDRQDRTRWLGAAIAEAEALLDRALRRGEPGPYQTQAAISAMHCRAKTYAETDWPEVVRLYDALRALAPSDVVELNRAVAVSRVDGPRAGLARVDALASPPLVARHAWHAVRAGLLEELGLADAAVAAYREAAARTENRCEIEYFRTRIEVLSSAATARRDGDVGNAGPGSS